MKVDDQLIIREIQKRNRAVFEALFKKYYPIMARYAERFVFGRAESEDIAQNLFISLWESADKLSITTNLKAYLFQAVRNRCLNHLRAIKVTDKRRLLYLEAMFAVDDDSSGADPEVTTSIKEALRNLPAEMAKIFELRYLVGKKQKEIAKDLQISENTVKTQLLRAKDKLRRALSPCTEQVNSPLIN
ncbi:MAG: RNA polymerase sigma factor [Cyclobacteriaceae bacterium]